MKFHLKKFLFAVPLVFIASTLVPFVTFNFFEFSFALEPANFWRFTPATPIESVPINWIVATIVANSIIAFFAVLAYYVFHRAISGSWLRKGLIFGSLAVILGVFVPVWSMYTITNLHPIAAPCWALDGAFEYMLYSLLIAYVWRDK